MTDIEIIKALECCACSDGCENCPYSKQCDGVEQITNALDLINRQKSEIERLSDRSHKCIYLSDDETTEYCVDGPCPKFKTEERIKVEAFEEFAKRLKSEYINDKRYDRPNAHTLLVCLFGKIDSILKEKVGEG